MDKMIRWGATVSDAEKQALVDYLALRFPAQIAPEPIGPLLRLRVQKWSSPCSICSPAVGYTW